MSVLLLKLEEKEKTIGVIMIAKLTKVRNTNVEFVVEFDHNTWTCYGKNASFFRSYTSFLGHNKFSILIDD